MKRWILDLSLAKMYRANGLSLQINNDWNKIHSSTIPICKVALTCMTKTWSDDNDRERKTDQPRKKTLSYVYNNIVLPYYGLEIHFSDTWPGVQVPVFRKSRLLYGPSAILSNLTLGSSRAKKKFKKIHKFCFLSRYFYCSSLTIISTIISNHGDFRETDLYSVTSPNRSVFLYQYSSIVLLLLSWGQYYVHHWSSKRQPQLVDVHVHSWRCN